MSNWYFDQIVLHERMNDVARAVERQRQIDQALVVRRQRRVILGRIAVAGSRVLIVVGRRLVMWGQRLQQPQEVCLR